MNLDKLDAAIAYIEAHPDEWNQQRWFSQGDGGCGTAYCLAGTIAVLDGWTPTGWDPLVGWSGREAGAVTAVAEKDGVEDFADNIAMNVLGAQRSDDNEPYSPDERLCNDLFEADNTLDDIKRLRDERRAATSGEAGERSDTPNASDLGGDR